ncbi:MAG: hypothetical protein AAFO07_06735 [Bacteroidota bacterium]
MNTNAYFEEQLRPHINEISNRSIRLVVENLLSYNEKKESKEKKKELEAKTNKIKPRPEGEELERILKKLKEGELAAIEDQHIKTLIEELLQYAKLLSQK